MPKRTRTRWQRARDKMLTDAGVTRADVHRRLLADPQHACSVKTVNAVIAGAFRNVDVERAFCELTGATADAAFPLDEPPYGRKRTRQNFTRALAARRGSDVAR